MKEKKGRTDLEFTLVFRGDGFTLVLTAHAKTRMNDPNVGPSIVMLSSWL